MLCRNPSLDSSDQPQYSWFQVFRYLHHRQRIQPLHCCLQAHTWCLFQDSGRSCSPVHPPIAAMIYIAFYSHSLLEFSSYYSLKILISLVLKTRSFLNNIINYSINQMAYHKYWNRYNSKHIFSVNSKKQKCQTWKNSQTQYNNGIRHTYIIKYPT